MEKKQSSIDILMKSILESDVELYISMQESGEFEQIKAMHKEEIKDAISVGYNMATPIQIPTDEEIYINSNVNSENKEQHIGFIKGIQLMRELIKNNK